MCDWGTNFRQNLRHLRQVHNMSQKEMARILGVSVSTYGRIERCERTVRLHSGMVVEICDHFQISADELLQQNWPKMKEKNPAP